MSVEQPPWDFPRRRKDEPVLKIYNSLTHTKTEFVPRNDRIVKWYNCGPTVYETSHMGHARNYVTQDILRRIMTDYFGYNVHFVMNITDIDDKIIENSRQNHLFDKFSREISDLSDQLITQVQSAWKFYLRTCLARGLPGDEKIIEGQEDHAWERILEQVKVEDWKLECLKRDLKFDMHLKAAARTHSALEAALASERSKASVPDDARKLVDASQDVVKVYLDAQYGETVTDPSVSLSHASHYEKLFFEDMARLRVRNPDTIMRVTEFIPEIILFIQEIVKNGYGYEVDGSIYFDTEAFDGKNGHHYAKLEPWSKGNRKLIQEGEGSLTFGRGRRSPSDFALWKASKPAEPSWPSPWGPGRPGWHIECSVMASIVFGDNLDIHSGGVDLAFPHHDNEMAQAEAYHRCHSWVNYFLHTGHLHIEGLKMSKSLKNFITIDEIMQKYSSRQIRLAFLTQLWNAKMDFSESLMTGEVKSIELSFNNFFTNVKAVLNRSSKQHEQYYGEDEVELTKKIYNAQSAFHAALCDSFDTSEGLGFLRELVSSVNVYMNLKGKNANSQVVEYAAGWVGKMLRMFGLGEGNDGELGWGQASGEEAHVNREEILMPYLHVLSSFRDGIRKIAIGKGGDAMKDILTMCDKLRDSDLIPLGVALDDQEGVVRLVTGILIAQGDSLPDARHIGGQALVKLMPPSELMKAREEKEAQAEAKAAKKAAAIEAERQKRLHKLEKGRVAPENMFKPPHVPEGMYSSWSDAGLPLTDGEGKELSKNQVKKLQKDWANQKRLHEEYLRCVGEDT